MIKADGRPVSHANKFLLVPLASIENSKPFLSSKMIGIR